MIIEEVMFYKLVCPYCGTKITMTRDEYLEFLNKTEEYGNKIVCTEKIGEETCEVEYYNFTCPSKSCGHYIPVTLSDFDADIYGFKCSPSAKVEYGAFKKMSIDDYLNEEVEEKESIE